MEPTDMTIEILKGIREDVREVSTRLDEQTKRLDGRLDGTNVRLERLHERQVEMEVRLATELVNVVGAIHEVRDELRSDRALRARVDEHDRRLERLESRSG